MPTDLFVPLIGGCLAALAFWLLRQTPWRKRWSLDLHTELGQRVVVAGVVASLASLVPALISIQYGASTGEALSGLMGLWLLIYLTVLVISRTRGG